MMSKRPVPTCLLVCLSFLGGDRLAHAEARTPIRDVTPVASANKPSSRRETAEPRDTDLAGDAAIVERPWVETGQLPESSPSDLAESLLTWESWTSPSRLVGSLRVFAVMAALSLAPALLLMTTCYVRIIVILSLLRQALGSQQLPPHQVTTTLALFLTVLIMFPVWTQVHDEAIKPYIDPDVAMTFDEVWQAGVAPIREFMSQQIVRAQNGDDVRLFLDYLPPQSPPPQSYADVPLQALLPAFLVSELKVAFLIGFQVYLPFVIVDLVVSSVTMSMGMVMVPPLTISLPLKLLLFVLVDGWHLVVEMLLQSFSM